MTEPMGFGQMEVPQIVEAGGRFHLLFSSDPGTRFDAHPLARRHFGGTLAPILRARLDGATAALVG